MLSSITKYLRKTVLLSAIAFAGVLQAQTINYAEYFINTDPGVGNAIPITVGADINDVTVNFSTSAQNLTPGYHYLYVRTRTSNDLWSTYQMGQFFVKSKITDAEYFIDNDPGVGNGIPMAVADLEDSVTSNFAITGVSATPGIHYLYIRTKDDNNNWSLTAVESFFVKNSIVAAECFFNTDPGPGNGTPLTVSQSEDSVSFSGNITSPNLPSGNNFLHVRTKDGSGAWSLYEQRMFTVRPSIVSAEYFIDIDPGVGNGVAMAIPNSEDSVVVISTTDVINCLDSGMHYLYVRTKNSDGVWSLHERDTFYISSPAPIISASGPSTVCAGDSVLLSVNTGAACSYQWYLNNVAIPSATSATYLANVGGDYKLELTTSGVTYTSNIITLTIGGGAVPTVVASGPTTFCAGGTIVLTALPNGSASYLWSSGDTTQTITVAASGNYFVSVTDTTGCVAAVSETVIVNANPTAIINPVSATICSGSSTTLTASGAPNFLWSTGVNTAAINVSPNSGTTYIVTVTDANNCSGTASRLVNVNAVPTVSASNTGSYCLGGIIQLNAGGAANYVWSGPTGFNNNTASPTRSAIAAHAGTYTVVGTDANSCSASAQTVVVVNGTPASITPSGATTFCSGGSVDLTASVGSIYSWSTGSSSATITATTGGSYSVTITDANGCTASTTQSVMVNPLPTVNASNTGPYCSGYNIQLNASGTNVASYSWSGVNGFTSSTQNPTINNSINANFGAYIVTATSSASCTVTATTTVVSNGNAPVLTYSGNTNFISSIVNPTMASPYTTFRFEVSYSDADGNLPAANYPRLILDYEGNGVFTNANDRLFIMQEVDPADTDVTDGKLYFYNATGLPVGLNYQTRILVNDNSPSACTTTFGPFATPDVLDDADIFIYANDITFSESNPDTSAPLQVCATIHNESDYPAINFVVHLRNQYDTLANYGDIVVPFLAAHGTTNVCWNITTPAEPSWNPMQVLIDYTNTINEPNELNNQAIRPFVCGNFILPGDIKLTADVNPQTSYAVANNWLGISGRATYRNTAVPLQDPSCAGATVTVFVPSTGASYSTYSNSQGYYNLSFIAPVTPGVYDVEVSVTDFTLDGDTTAPFALNTPPCVPDLSAYFNLPNATLVVGQTIPSFQYQISNVGCANVNVNTLATWSSNGSTNQGGSHATAAPLNAGSSQYFTIPALTFPTAGNYSICVNADANYNVVETNENNTLCRGVSVLPACADLTAGVFSLNGSYQQCQPAGFSFSVNNVGGLSSGASTFARLVIKQGGVIEAIYNNVVPNLGAQSSTTFSYNHSFSNSGVYELVFSVDTTNVISECSESNNMVVAYTSANTCVYKPDLYVQGCSSFNVTPVNPLSSPTIDVTAVIANGGNAIATGPFVVRFNIAGTIVNHNFVGNLAPGATSTITINIPTPASPGGSLSVIADATNLVTDEWNEGNNTATETACHDFSLGNDCLYTLGNDFWEKSQLLNQPFTLGVWLYSNGLYKASSVKTKFEISGPGLTPGWNDLGFATLNNVNRTCSCPYYTSLALPFACPSVGTYQVRMTVDYDAQYAECSEGNNVMIVSFSCTNLPDYRTLSQYIAPSLLNPEPNQPISIDISYENIGASNIGDSLEVKLYIDEIAVDSVRDRTLATGDIWTTHIPNTWSSPIVGVHILRAVIDSKNEIQESNEGGNNEATRAIVVGQSPNLRFAQLAASDPTPQVGDEITFNVTIANDGDQDAQSTILFKYINNNGDTIPIYALNNVNFPNNNSVSFSFNWTVADASTFVFGYIVNTTPGEYLYDDNYAYTQLGALSISFVSTQETCISANNGSLLAHVSGGTPPYSYIWSAGGADSTLVAGSGTYTLTVVDTDGNIGNGGGIITTVPDVTNPIIGNVPANIVYNATNGICPAAISWSAPMASDNCGIDSFYSNKQPGDLFSAGVTTIAYTAKDKAGRTTTASFTVTVIGLPLAFAGNDETICGSGTLSATIPLFGSGAWSVATGNATFGNSSSPNSAVSSLNGGQNRLAWTISNGTCGTISDTVVITQPIEVCGNSIDDDCDGTVDDGCAPLTPVWNGSVSSDWSDPLNWTPNVTPTGCAVNVIIPDLPIDPVVNSPVSIGSVTINSNATLVVNSTFNVCGNWVGGTTTDALIFGTGEIEFTSLSPQQISGKSEFTSLKISNSQGVNLAAGAVVEINDLLQLETGVFTTTGATLKMRSLSDTHYSIVDNFSAGYTGSILGNIVAERYVPVAGINQHYIGSPVINTSFAQLGATNPTGGFVIPTPNCDQSQTANNSPYGNIFQWHDNTPANATCLYNGWEVKTSSGTAQAGRGYSVYLPNGTFSITGQLNQGNSYNVSVPGSYASWESNTLQTVGTIPAVYKSGWHMVSNPFLAPIQLSGHTPDFTSAAVWVTSGPFSGSYQPVNITGGQIPPFQGFIVRRSSTTAPGVDFTFDKSECITTPGIQFYKTASEHQLSVQVSGNGFNDITRVEFNSATTNAFDVDYDAFKPMSALGQPTLSSFNTDITERLAINVNKSIAETPNVQLNFVPGNNGTFSFTVDGINTFDPTSYVTLEDTKEGTMTDLRQNPTYTFAALKTDNHNRFVLHFTPAAAITTVNGTCTENGTLSVTQDGPADWNYTITSSNDTTTIAAGTLNSTSPINQTVPMGTYQITLTDNSGYQVIKNVQVNGQTPIAAATMTTTNTNVEEDQTITVTNTTNNTTTTNWNFGDGTTATTNTADHTYTEPGIYTVTLTVTNADGCHSTATQTITVTEKVNTGITTTTKEIIHIYPNPASTKLNINISKVTAETQLTLTNALGQTIQTLDKLKQGVNTIDVSQLAEGLYLITVNEGKAVLTTQRIVISQ